MAKVSTSRKTPKTTGGVRVDSRLSRELAAEAERGYDLSKAKRQRVGRPSLGGLGASPRVSFRASRELYDAATQRARKEGRSVSELARDAVARYVKS
jgi:predicted HicB family RNase H-like nuclease